MLGVYASDRVETSTRKTKLSKVDDGKLWYGMMVKGRDISITQANEILLRTDDWSLDGNYPEIQRYLWKQTGVLEERKESTNQQFKQRKAAFLKKIGHVKLRYFHNQMILSRWERGPHGWCNWNGMIGVSTYNVGPNLDMSKAYEDWITIAQAFPFLDLKCQILAGEITESNIPIAEFRIKKGKAEYVSKGLRLLCKPNPYFTYWQAPDVRSTSKPLAEVGLNASDLEERIEKLLKKQEIHYRTDLNFDTYEYRRRAYGL